MNAQMGANRAGKADRHLEPCTEDCKFNKCGGVCSFSLRNSMGCYLEDRVKVFVDSINDDKAREINTLDIIEHVLR